VATSVNARARRTGLAGALVTAAVAANAWASPSELVDASASSGGKQSCEQGLRYDVRILGVSDGLLVLEHRIENCSTARAFWLSHRRFVSHGQPLWDMQDIVQTTVDAAEDGSPLENGCTQCPLGIDLGDYVRLPPGKALVWESAAFSCVQPKAGHRYRLRFRFRDVMPRAKRARQKVAPFRGRLDSNELIAEPGQRDLGLPVDAEAGH
jgi:hypothetical protein